MEMDNNKYSLKKLNDRSYRNLQNIAKSMELPSNVKKAHLVELIHAKACKTEDELNKILYKVKLERREKSVSKRGKHLKKYDIRTSEVSSTCNNSPPITETPNRLNAVVINDTSNAQQSLLKNNRYKPNKAYTKTFRTYLTNIQPAASDRVLRSSRERPDYRLMNSSILDLINFEHSPAKVNKKKRASRASTHPVFNLISVAKEVTSKARDIPRRSQHGSIHTNQNKPTNKRHRKLSGISPLITLDKSNTYVKTMNFTHQNGKMARLKAFVEKPKLLVNRSASKIIYPIVKDAQRANVRVCLLRETEIPSVNDTHTVQSLDQQGSTETKIHSVDFIIGKTRNGTTENLIDPNAGYRCIGTDQLGNQMVELQTDSNKESVDGLAHINAFSTFNDSERNVLEPIYIQVCANFVKTPTIPVHSTNESTTASGCLEHLYNFKSQHLTSPEPWQYISTTSNTTCVFSTPIITTAVQQTPATGTNESNACDLSMEDSQYDTTLYELLPIEDGDTPRNVFVCHEVINSSSSLETMNCIDLSTNAPIPQAVEDALDLISQDKEYMERVALHMCMQCFYCAWAGPKVQLESHLKQNHMDEIETFEGEEWVTTYTLGGLVQRDVWVCRVVQYCSAFYVLSAKYEDPDVFMASVNSMKSEETATEIITKIAKITAFNKVTGEPFTWEGPVNDLPHTMPYYKDTDCFKLELSKMNLLPNSANLKLMNRELVLTSPSKVIVGQPALHDIHINLFIKLSDVVP